MREAMSTTQERTRARPGGLWLALLLCAPLAGGLGCKKAEVCDDGEDNDRDELTDCDDVEDCSAAPNCVLAEVCDDGADNDGDGDADCADADCAADPSCQEAGNCDDGADNDLDGLIDCADGDCANDPVCLGEVEDCDNGVDDDADGLIDCADGDCAANPSCDLPSTATLSVGDGFQGALAVAISNDGATTFFTGYNASDEAAVFSVPTAGGAATELFAGAPLDKPTGLALSANGATLLIADLSSGATELGGVFSLPVGGGAPTAINIANLVRPSVIATSDNGNTLFVGAAQASDGATGIFSVGINGGNATLLSLLQDPAALAVSGNQVLAVESLGADNRASVVKIPAAGGAPTVLASGLRIDYPAGVSSLVDNGLVLFSAVDPAAANFGAAVFQVGINGGPTSLVDLGLGFVSAGALARSRTHNSFVLVDTEAGANVTGGIFRVQ